MEHNSVITPKFFGCEVELDCVWEYDALDDQDDWSGRIAQYFAITGLRIVGLPAYVAEEVLEAMSEEDNFCGELATPVLNNRTTQAN